MSAARKTIIVLGILFIIYSVYFMFFFRGGSVHEISDVFGSQQFVTLLIGSLFVSTIFFKKEY